jgi:hypothetical protein
MTTSGFREHGGDGAPRGPSQAPVLSVLVFRATANGSSPGTDTQFPDMIATSSPPTSSPPTSSKVTFACDGAVQTGAGNTATFITNSSKRGGTHQDSSFAHPNNPNFPCATTNLIFT